MDHPPLRPLVWVGSSQKDFLRFPRDVQADFTQQLHLVRIGERPPGETLLTKGELKGLGIREVRVDYDKDTYRVIYTVRLASAIYVLHAFKKKSKFGISTPRHDMELVVKRYRDAARYDAEQRSRSARSE